MDNIKTLYGGLLFCLLEYLLNEFESYYTKTKIHGWKILHEQVLRIELNLNQIDIHEDTPFPNKELHIQNMKECQSLAKELLGNHTHINFLWRIEQMLRFYDKRHEIRFEDFEIK